MYSINRLWDIISLELILFGGVSEIPESTYGRNVKDQAFTPLTRESLNNKELAYMQEESKSHCRLKYNIKDFKFSEIDNSEED